MPSAESETIYKGTPHVAAALAPLARLASLPDRQALAALGRLPLEGIRSALDELITPALCGQQLEPSLNRLLSRIAGWLEAHNKPIPPDDGSRQWERALAARLDTLGPLVAVAGDFARLAAQSTPLKHYEQGSDEPAVAFGWDASLRFRLLCAGALCIDSAPQVLLAAWHGARAAVGRQRETARLAAALLPSMLDSAQAILAELYKADSSQDAPRQRLVQQSEATSDAKLLAFLHFVGQAAPDMLALAGAADACTLYDWPTLLRSLRLVLGTHQAHLASLLRGNPPEIEMGLLSLALYGLEAVQQRLAVLQTAAVGSAADCPQQDQQLGSDEDHTAWQHGMSSLLAAPLVPAWRALEAAARSPSLPYATQAQQLRERVVAAVQQLQQILGMELLGEPAAAAGRVSLTWFGSQLAAGMRHAASVAAGAQQAQQDEQQAQQAQQDEQQAQQLRWVWSLATAVSSCVETAASSFFPLQHAVVDNRGSASGSKPAGGNSASSSGAQGGSSVAPRVAWVADQLRETSEVLSVPLPAALAQSDGRAAITAQQRFSDSLQATATRVPASGAGLCSELVETVSRAAEVAVRAAASQWQQDAPGSGFSNKLRALITAQQSSLAACTLHRSALAGAADCSGWSAPLLQAHTALLGLARSAAKLLLLWATVAPTLERGSWRYISFFVRHAADMAAAALSTAAYGCPPADSIRRHQEGTVLACITAAKAAGKTLVPSEGSGSNRASLAGAAACMCVWGLAAAPGLLGLPASCEAASTTLDGLSAVLDGPAPCEQRALLLDGLAVLGTKMEWLVPDLCRRALLSPACHITFPAYPPQGFAADVAAAWRLVQSAAAQLSALPEDQLPPAAAAKVAEAAQALAGVRASLPFDVAELRHWCPKHVVAAATAALPEAERCKAPATDPPEWARLLKQAAQLLESAAAEAGAALPQQPAGAVIAAGEEEEQQQQLLLQQQRAQQLAVARALKPLRCAHLGCTNVAGSSEAQLPCRLCSACRQVRYCSAECAAAAWPQHRPACKLMRRA